MALDYTSVDNLLLEVPRLGSVTTITSANLVTICQRAEAEVNARLAKLYQVPVSPAPPILVTIATDLSAQRVLRRMFTREKQNKSDWVDSYGDSRETLKELASGAMSLVASDGTIIGGRTDVALLESNNMGYEPTFTELDTFDHITDPDKIDDLLSERGWL